MPKLIRLLSCLVALAVPGLALAAPDPPQDRLEVVSGEGASGGERGAGAGSEQGVSATVASTERMLDAARGFAQFWVDHDLERVGALYRKDAVFISPNPPFISPEFGTVLNGRDEILRYFQANLDRYPGMMLKTVDILLGVDMAIWIYEPRPGKLGADVLLFDEDGLIMTQRVTAPAG